MKKEVQKWVAWIERTAKAARVKTARLTFIETAKQFKLANRDDVGCGVDQVPWSALDYRTVVNKSWDKLYDTERAALLALHDDQLNDVRGYEAELREAEHELSLINAVLGEQP